jgi:phosphoribosylaminoimidazole carboxylase (NCAIR synthetase)
MSFSSKFLEAIHEEETLAHNEYHKAIKNNKDWEIIYWGQRYEMARDLRRAISSLYDHQAITDMFEEIANKIKEENYNDIKINKSISIWPIERAPLKYKEFCLEKDVKWVAFVPIETKNEFEHFLENQYVYIDIENPYDKDSVLFFY